MKLLPIMGQAVEPRERADAARNRRRILEAARKLIRRRPIHEICMDEVAKAAGVGKGTLYRRFVDRASLCHALLDDNERRLQDRVLRGFDLAPGAAPARHLAVLLDALFTFVVDNAAILAEAEASHRGQVDRFEHLVYQWRRKELLRWLTAVGAAPDLAAVTAELVLSSLSAELVLHLLHQGHAAEDLRRSFLEIWGRVCPAREAPEVP